MTTPKGTVRSETTTTTTTTTATTKADIGSGGRFYGLNADFDTVVHRFIALLDRERLADLKKDFFTRLRLSAAHPERAELVEDLWDFFYDWCVFDQRLFSSVEGFPDNEKLLWDKLKTENIRGVFLVQKITEKLAKLKDLYSGKVATVKVTSTSDFFGISKGDLVECRIIKNQSPKELCLLVRRPSYHPLKVHDYLNGKVREFKKSQDFTTYQSWLWLVVGMHLKHRIYSQMPIEKIYDDNSRI